MTLSAPTNDWNSATIDGEICENPAEVTRGNLCRFGAAVEPVQALKFSAHSQIE